MGNGKSGLIKGKQAGTSNIAISGDVDFQTIIKASPNSISFGKVVTVSPEKFIPESGKKSDLGQLLAKYNINDAVIHTYRDKAGKNDLKRLQDLGFEIVATYKGEQQEGSKIPPLDYFYIKRKKK